ncbi:hypothetical protein BGX27_004409 [Mortierella sp. AM989]|nr:hypothetical protein BGX27_004409 [Mortierella sp. AM989]
MMATIPNVSPPNEPNVAPFATTEPVFSTQLSNVAQQNAVKEHSLERSLSEEEKAKFEAAAIKIQSQYRGHQARRELYGSALTSTRSWKYLIDFSRSAHIHKIHAEGGLNDVDQGQALSSTTATTSDDNIGDKARWAWRRAEFLGSRLGKGSSAVTTEEALVLLTEHWLEMSDIKHRYGTNLKHCATVNNTTALQSAFTTKPYHEYWLTQETSQNFFFWLDKGEGKDLNFEERPRTCLDEQRVRYLQEHERIHYAVEAVDGLLYYKISNKPVHTLSSEIKAGDSIDVSTVLPDKNEHDDEATRLEKKRIRNKAKFIYVTDPRGTLYVAQKVKGKFHHSSFLGGGSVCAAGGIVINNGKLLKITPNSGHYRPGQLHFDKLLKNLKDMGISLEDVKISYGILKVDGQGTVGAEGRAEQQEQQAAPSEKENADESRTKEA